jgi:hypothetical protein
MKTLQNPERVQFWNSVLDLARAHAVDLSKGGGSISGGRNLKGGKLSAEQQSSLAVLAFATLAIEARANHLIDELCEKRKIGAGEADAAHRLPPEHKWFILPKLAGRRRSLRDDAPPHQAIKEICAQRNALMHFTFGKLRLPSRGKMISLFKQFVEAMEDMNVVLGRVRRRRRYCERLKDIP